MTELKKCTACKMPKEIECFVKDKSRSDGRYPVCRECRKGYYENNRERILKQYGEYRAANAPRLKIQSKAYTDRRFFYKTAGNMVSRAEEFTDNRGSGILKQKCAEISRLWKTQRGICPVSGRRLNRKNAQLDHIIPLKRGGNSSIENLRWVHRDVNYAKRDLLDSEFLSLCLEVIKVVHPEHLAAA